MGQWKGRDGVGGGEIDSKRVDDGRWLGWLLTQECEFVGGMLGVGDRSGKKGCESNRAAQHSVGCN